MNICLFLVYARERLWRADLSWFPNLRIRLLLLKALGKQIILDGQKSREPTILCERSCFNLKIQKREKGKKNKDSVKA